MKVLVLASDCRLVPAWEPDSDSVPDSESDSAPEFPASVELVAPAFQSGSALFPEPVRSSYYHDVYAQVSPALSLQPALRPLLPDSPLLFRRLPECVANDARHCARL